MTTPIALIPELIAGLPTLAAEIHTKNVKAGWWSDLQTGESILATRNRPELMMLVVSEVTEADHGLYNNLMDDKLSHLPMFDVELADVAIRLCDMIGAENSYHGGELDFDYLSVIEEASVELIDFDLRPERRLLTIVNQVSDAMEHIRKGRIAPYREKLSRALAYTVAVALLSGIDLFAVIDEKLSFNANREDHKVENRKKDGGKQF